MGSSRRYQAEVGRVKRLRNRISLLEQIIAGKPNNPANSGRRAERVALSWALGELMKFRPELFSTPPDRGSW